MSTRWRNYGHSSYLSYDFGTRRLLLYCIISFQSLFLKAINYVFIHVISLKYTWPLSSFFILCFVIRCFKAPVRLKDCAQLLILVDTSSFYFMSAIFSLSFVIICAQTFTCSHTESSSLPPPTPLMFNIHSQQ